MTTPLPGDFGVVATYGSRLDKLAAQLIRYGTDSPVNHAFVYVGGGQIVEAQPGGAVISPVTKYRNVTWSNGHAYPFLLMPIERERIVNNARVMVGTPYGWLDIAAIALAQHSLGARVNSDTWWVKRIARTKTLICSQLVDVAYQAGGVHMFNDNRLPGLVSPGDLYRLITPPTATVKDAA